jgi:hypothetical protein
MSCQHQTQKQLVLKHMRTRGSITTLIAFDKYQVCRLSERIRELEQDGHVINRGDIKRNGKHYTAYSLIEYRRRAA